MKRRIKKKKRPKKRSPSSKLKIIVATKKPEVGIRNIRKVVAQNDGL